MGLFSCNEINDIAGILTKLLFNFRITKQKKSRRFTALFKGFDRQVGDFYHLFIPAVLKGLLVVCNFEEESRFLLSAFFFQCRVIFNDIEP